MFEYFDRRDNVEGLLVLAQVIPPQYPDAQSARLVANRTLFKADDIGGLMQENISNETADATAKVEPPTFGSDAVQSPDGSQYTAPFVGPYCLVWVFQLEAIVHVWVGAASIIVIVRIQDLVISAGICDKAKFALWAMKYMKDSSQEPARLASDNFS